ncbi:MAG: DEAD/DEAH box helicase [Bdellovibrionota bacterium]|nr:DEAD/DEAH box helicase [Bdellovibrionota bacterium]
MQESRFLDFPLSDELQRSLKKLKYTVPTAIQLKAIPEVLAAKDVLGIAQTGTGKTAAFCLPLLDQLIRSKSTPVKRSCRLLILAPTRELAIQLFKKIKSYGYLTNLSFALIYGGVGKAEQIDSLRQGVDVLVATPGRLLDLWEYEKVEFDSVEHFVLDEADRMLDMGFIDDLEDLIRMLPQKRQNLFFSATMSPEVKTLSEGILNNPSIIEVAPPATVSADVDQKVMYVDKEHKLKLLFHVIDQNPEGKFLIFVDMKRTTRKLGQELANKGHKVSVINGDKLQAARQQAINEFAKGSTDILVATDVAARGLDIQGVTHVINYELTHIAESYVHRIGRVGRAGKKGYAISFTTGDEKSYLAHAEKLTKEPVDLITDQPFHSKKAFDTPLMKVGKAKAKIEREKGKVERLKKGMC